MGFEEVKKFKYKFKRNSSINIELIEEFSCGSEELDKKLIQMKENDEGTTICFLDETNGQIIGYCTYCASGLKKAYENDSITYPAAEIKYFSIDKTYQHKSYLCIITLGHNTLLTLKDCLHELGTEARRIDENDLLFFSVGHFRREYILRRKIYTILRC